MAGLGLPEEVLVNFELEEFLRYCRLSGGSRP